MHCVIGDRWVRYYNLVRVACPLTQSNGHGGLDDLAELIRLLGGIHYLLLCPFAKLSFGFSVGITPCT